jgi:hypothetical protein
MYTETSFSIPNTDIRDKEKKDVYIRQIAEEGRSHRKKAICYV